MTTTATTIKCPDWCTTRHDRDPDGGHDGDHDGPNWPNVPSTSGSEGVNSVSIGTGLDTEHGCIVYIEATNLNLTPEQAHTAGLALLSAASWAKDHQVPVLSAIMQETPLYAPPFAVERITTEDIGRMVKAIRSGLSVEVSELAKASGLRRKRIEAIEGATTADERHHIAAGVASLLTTYTTEATA